MYCAQCSQPLLTSCASLVQPCQNAACAYYVHIPFAPSHMDPALLDPALFADSALSEPALLGLSDLSSNHSVYPDLFSESEGSSCCTTVASCSPDPVSRPVTPAVGFDKRPTRSPRSARTAHTLRRTRASKPPQATARRRKATTTLTPDTLSAITPDMMPFLKMRGGAYHISRPSNSWMLYRSDKVRAMKEGGGGGGGGGDDRYANTSLAVLSRAISEAWACESDSVREEYAQRALALAEQHRMLFPNYTFQPRRG